jgi:hypothetical protein
MQPTTLTLIWAIVFNALIMYLIIASVTKSHARYKLEWAQMKLLAEIAKIQGVDENLVNDIINKSA